MCDVTWDLFSVSMGVGETQDENSVKTEYRSGTAWRGTAAYP